MLDSTTDRVGHDAAITDGANGLRRSELHRVGDARILRAFDFLPSAEATELLRDASRREAEFMSARDQSGNSEYRRSRVIYGPEPHATRLRALLRSAAPGICAALRMPLFPMGFIECQLTATLDGGFFRPHRDNAGRLGYRRLTFVYYLNRTPRPFTGGELRCFDRHPATFAQSDVRHTLDIPPVHNSIVFFDSACLHEVRPVSGAVAWADARFTLNGWMGTSDGG